MRVPGTDPQADTTQEIADQAGAAPRTLLGNRSVAAIKPSRMQAWSSGPNIKGPRPSRLRRATGTCEMIELRSPRIRTVRIPCRSFAARARPGTIFRECLHRSDRIPCQNYDI